VRLSAQTAQATVTFRAPEKWSLADGQNGAQLTRQGKDYILDLRAPLANLMRTP